VIKIKNKKIISRGVYFLLLICGLSFGILFSSPIGETPSAIYDGTDSRDTVAPQSADNPVTYEWNITWGLREFHDWGYGMVLDSSDNIYIVGTTENLEDTYDMCLVKFNSSGVLQWYRTWGGDGIDRGFGIALDSSENIYIVGETRSFGAASSDMCLVKFDGSGVEQWYRTWGGSSFDNGYAIVLDSSDNIYITGRSVHNGYIKVILVKYDSSGVEQWYRRWYSGGSNSGNGIALDSVENIYIVGKTEIPQGSSDMCLLKYDNSGGLQWSRTWGNSAGDYGESVAIDSSDNVYAVGNTNIPGEYGTDIGLAKYDSSGVLQWYRTWGGNDYDYALAITLDWYGDIFLAGYTYSFGAVMDDMLLVKYSHSGVYQWNRTWGGSSGQCAYAIALDSSQNIYLVGSTNYYDGFGYVADICMVKYKSDFTTTLPKIRIISPTPDEFFSNNAPDFQLSIFDASINTTWYTFDDGVTNITFSGLTGTIDQTEWDKKGDGDLNLRFYVNNTLGNSSYSEVTIKKDTTQPLITIDSPLEYELFGWLSPSFDLSVVELNISSMWYSLDGGSTNITSQELTGTINQNEWDKYGNGTVSINFYVKDEAENEGSVQVTIRKETIPPLITINSPNDNDLYHSIAPTFELAIQEPYLETTWYTLDDGVTPISFTGLTGNIDQSEWDKLGNGTVTIQFYANDTVGNEGMSQITIHKDIAAPIVYINYPIPGLVFSTLAPEFDISVVDSQLDSMWYTIDRGLTLIPIVSTTGTIDQTEWDKKGEELVEFWFYANDSLGNTAFSYRIIVKDTIQPIITINSPSLYDITGVWAPSFNLSIVEPNLDSVWYTLDNGVTNISTVSLSGTIDLAEWIKFGNETVTIRFYASDLAGHVGFSEVTVLKDIITPIITINSPNVGDLYTNIAPSFSISIEEPNLNLIWYTLDGGVTTISISSLTGVINQIEWDKLGNGTVTIQFYASDTVGNEGMSQITVYKDITAPLIVINSPTSDEIFSLVAPAFDITVVDNQFDSMWYTIDGGLTLIPMVSTSGTVDQSEWDKNGGGNIYIRFYANDTLGNSGYLEVRIIKDVLFGIDLVDLLTPSTFSELYSTNLDFSWTSLDLGFGVVNFTLQISDAIDFSNIFFEVDNIAETLIFTNFSGQIPIAQGQCYWRVRPTYRNNVGTWSDYFSFILNINNYAPSMTLIECTPTTGTRETIFRFTAMYYDLDDNPPLFINIILDGISYFMEKASPSDIDFTDGCIYQYLTLLTPSTTVYTISFECSDGAFQYSTSTYQGPLVEFDSTPSNNQGDYNIFSTDIFAIIMTLGITIGGIVPSIVFVEIKKRKIKSGEKTSIKMKKKTIKS